MPGIPITALGLEGCMGVGVSLALAEFAGELAWAKNQGSALSQRAVGLSLAWTLALCLGMLLHSLILSFLISK